RLRYQQSFPTRRSSDLLKPEMERTAGEIRELGGEALALEADVASHRRALEVAAEAKRRFDRIDFLLNDAGAPMPKGILEIEEEEDRKSTRLNSSHVKIS